MKVFKCDFIGMYPVPRGLIIAAENIRDATILMNEILNKNSIDKHDRKIKEIKIEKLPQVVFFESGNY